MSSPPPSSTGGVHPHRVLLGSWSVGVALVVLLGAVTGGWLFEPERLGIELCWLRAIHGLPCPGCGLTRSVCHLARGELGQAVWFHPFGLLVLPFAMVAGSSLLWPRALQARVHAAIDHHRRGVDLFYRGAVLAFLLYGFLRAVAVAVGIWPAWG